MEKLLIGGKPHTIVPYSFVQSILYCVNIVFEIYSNELTSWVADNPNSRRSFACVEMLTIYITLHQCLHFYCLWEIAMFVFEVQSSVYFSLPFDEKQNIVEHVALVYNYLILGEFAQFGYGRHYPDHKTVFILNL
jgi:hypothetical protein